MGNTELTLSEYSSLISCLPRPTPKQMEGFAHYVASDHSWEKHLPLVPPGKPFQFFVDPCAGMQRVRNRDGSVCVAHRDGRWGSPGMATEKYRDRFGHLAYCRSAGSSILFGDTGGALLVPSDTAPTVYDLEKERLCRVPDVIIEAGTAWVSGAVHPRAMGPHAWREVSSPYAIGDHPGEIPPGRSLPGWPAESGGKKTLQKILHRAAMLLDDPSLEESAPSSLDDPSVADDPDIVEMGFYTVDDLPLFRLIVPERRRQLRGMVKAMERVLELTFGNCQEEGELSTTDG